MFEGILLVTPTIPTTMHDGFEHIISHLDNLIFVYIFSMFFALMYIAISIGVIKKMFLFGNIQGLSTANKIIVTAFLSGLVSFIIIPIKDDLVARLDKNQIETITISEGDVSDKTVMGPIEPTADSGNRYVAFADALVTIKEAIRGIYLGIYGLVSVLAAVSIAISAIRIKLSFGNQEVINESRKMIKITLFALITILAANGIFQYFIDLFNDIGLQNPILTVADKENGTYNGDGIPLSHRSDVLDKSNLRYDRYNSPGVVQYADSQLDKTKTIRVRTNETYAFKKFDKDEPNISYSMGSLYVATLPNKCYIVLYINYGYQALVMTRDGHVAIRVPRKETRNSILTNVNEGDLLFLKEGQDFPDPLEYSQKVIYTSIFTPDFFDDNDFEYTLGLRNLGELAYSDPKWFGDNANEYSLSIRFSEDNEIQKVFKQMDEQDLKPGILMFDQKNFKGVSHWLEVDPNILPVMYNENDLNALGSGWNNRAASIKIIGNISFEAFRDPNYIDTNKLEGFDDIEDLGTHTGDISSIKFFKRDNDSITGEHQFYKLIEDRTIEYEKALQWDAEAYASYVDWQNVPPVSQSLAGSIENAMMKRGGGVIVYNNANATGDFYPAFDGDYTEMPSGFNDSLDSVKLILNTNKNSSVKFIGWQNNGFDNHGGGAQNSPSPREYTLNSSDTAGFTTVTSQTGDTVYIKTVNIQNTSDFYIIDSGKKNTWINAISSMQVEIN